MAIMKKITLEIGEEEFAFAERLAKQDGYCGPEDCLNGILNTAITNWRVHIDDMTPEQAKHRHLQKIIDWQNAEIRVLKVLVTDVLRANVKQEQELRALHLGETHEFDEANELEEDPGGGMCHKSDRGQSDDLDDGIPF